MSEETICERGPGMELPYRATTASFPACDKTDSRTAPLSIYMTLEAGSACLRQGFRRVDGMCAIEQRAVAAGNTLGPCWVISALPSFM
jgi:hypothetical protein